MIFVTVGTTPFDTLIKYLDNLVIKEDIVLQISDEAKYIPKNKKYFKFVKNINDYYTDAEVVISHSGAGSIYNLLELNKKIIIVPNLDRVDKHQLDITKYMSENNYAVTCENINELGELLMTINKINLSKYTKEDFFKIDDIKDLLTELYNI